MIDPISLQEMIDDSDMDLSDEPRQGPSRLAEALDSSLDGDCGPADLAVLIRDEIRQWQEQGGHRRLPAPIEVPMKPPWPSPDLWNSAGISTAPGREPGKLRLTNVMPWQPAWMPFREPIDSFPASRQSRSARIPVPADPVWRYSTGFSHNLSFEQREAVRTLATSPDDATVLIVLSTGSGKSLIGLLEALVGSSGRTTIVVVPTTSLAIDQEEQLRAVLRSHSTSDAAQDFAWSSGSSNEARSAILSRIRNGEQRVVFTSPESLFGVLGDVLAEAAKAGRIAQFVVDEAHMVASWGTEFRPEFQVLGGFRQRLRDQATENSHQFRTVLMSATINASDIKTLAKLFADDEKLVVAGAPSLRPEIAYLSAVASSKQERIDRVCDAVLHLPRPLFVYASKRADVQELVAALRLRGFRRIVSVTGDTSDEEKRKAVADLRGDPTRGLRPAADLAVGTSAFGLGIDVSDVRVVLHACLPETLDRYYQEVGRAGRDGLAALALMLWTPDDVGVARHLSAQKVIGEGLARKRWAAMVRSSEREGDTIWVPLQALRIGLTEDSDENEKWNSRTLSSMARAGFVRLVGSRRNDVNGVEIGVAMLRDDLDNEKAWTDYKAMHEFVRLRSVDSLNAVHELAESGQVCSSLLPVYTVQDPLRMTADLVVNDTCGGCVACSPPRPEPISPLSVEVAKTSEKCSAGVLELLDGSQCAFAVSDLNRSLERDLGRLIKAGSDAGIRQVVAEASIVSKSSVVRAFKESVLKRGLGAPLLTVLSEPAAGLAELDSLPNAATLLILVPDAPRPDLDAILSVLPRPTFVVVGPEQPSLQREDLTMFQMHPGMLTLQAMIDRLSRCQI